MSVELWLTRVKDISISPQNKSSSIQLSELFNIDINNPQVSSLQNDLFDQSINIDSKVDGLDLYDGDWQGFIELTKSYLKFCKDVDPTNPIESFYSFGQFFSDLQTAFSNTRGVILENTVYKSTKIIIPLTLSLDYANSKKMVRTSFIASILLKIFNSIRGDKSLPHETFTKKIVIIFVATMLCRLYFRLDQPSNCASVFSNIHTSNIKFSVYSKSQRVEYRYWLGRFHLNKNQLKNAYKHLHWSFQNCLSANYKNKRIILLYLLTPAILLGKIPRIELLQSYKLDSIYYPLIHSIKTANYKQFMNHLTANEQFFHSHRLLVILQARSPIILYRMIFHRLVKIKRQLFINDIKATSEISFEHFETAIKISMGEYYPNQLDPVADDHQLIESISVSLISQGFVKANIFPRIKIVKLKPVDALPRILNVHDMYNLDLTGNERWMET